MAVNGDRSSTRAYAGSSPGTAPTTGDGLRVALLDSDVPASGGNGRRTEGSVRKGGMLAAKRKTASLLLSARQARTLVIQRDFLRIRENGLWEFVVEPDLAVGLPVCLGHLQAYLAPPCSLARSPLRLLAQEI